MANIRTTISAFVRHPRAAWQRHQNNCFSAASRPAGTSALSGLYDIQAAAGAPPDERSASARQLPQSIHVAQQIEGMRKAAELAKWANKSLVHQQIYKRIEAWLANGDPNARLNFNGIRSGTVMEPVELPWKWMPPIAEIDFSYDPEPLLSILSGPLPPSLKAIYVSPRFMDEAQEPLSPPYVVDPTGLQPLDPHTKWANSTECGDSDQRWRLIARIREWEYRGDPEAPLNLNGINLNPDTRLPKNLIPPVKRIDIRQTNFSRSNLAPFFPAIPPASLKVIYISPELEFDEIPEPYRHLVVKKPQKSWSDWIAGAFDEHARREAVNRIKEWEKVGDPDAPLNLNGIQFDPGTTLPVYLLPDIRTIDVSQQDDVRELLPDEPPPSLERVYVSPDVARMGLYPERYVDMIEAGPPSPSGG